jgi:Fe-S-cluster containining protein
LEAAVKRFACTGCGKCCNRSPEVELSEAAALADVFVFRLMFRFYALPRALADYLRERASEANASEAFYQKKRLLSSNAALKRPLKIRRDGKPVEYTQYLTISALALETKHGACSALEGNRCGIYARRPHACRTVPFHYSRVDALAESELEAFVATEGYRCDTGESAPVVIQSGRIVDESMKKPRNQALMLSESDGPWRDAIVRRMKIGGSGDPFVPSLAEIEATASVGATTTSMRVAWQIAADAGLIGLAECKSLVAMQLALIDREFAGKQCPQDTRETLLEMRAEYGRNWGSNLISFREAKPSDAAAIG